MRAAQGGAALVVTLAGPLIEQGDEDEVNWKHAIEQALDRLEACGLIRVGSSNLGESLEIRFHRAPAG